MSFRYKKDVVSIRFAVSFHKKRFGWIDALKEIGANAFNGCKKLKTIKITSTKLTSKTVAKNAFKGLIKATTISVPKKMLSAYKKLFKSKGLSSKVTVKGY